MSQNKVCKPIGEKKIIQIAHGVLHKHYGRIPYDKAIDIDFILEKEGITTNVVYTDVKTVAASIALDMRTINIASRYYEAEKLNDHYYGRFSIAHELGHAVLHSYAVEEIAQEMYETQDLEHFFHYNDSLTLDENNEFEDEADRFAGELLAPGPVLKVKLAEIFANLRTEELEVFLSYGPSIIKRHNLDTLRPLVLFFEINPAAILFRIDQERIWWSTIHDEIAKRG
jgi:Zn-dependent peptidase ImmA (M78 family)